MSAERRGPAICNVSNIGEGKDEMTKASIDLLDLRRRIYVKSFGVKQMGARNAGNPHVACDEEGAGDVVWVGTPGHTGAPALDPTDERGVKTGPWSNQ